MKLNILHITPDFNYACGRSYYVFLLLKYLKAKRHNVLLLTNGGDSFDRLEELGIPYIISKNLHSKNIISFFKNVNFIKDLIKKEHFHIVHTHHRYSELLAVQASHSENRKISKTVFTSLSILNRRYSLEFKSDKIIAVSNTINNMLTDRFKVPLNRISLLSNFTDTDELNEQGIISPSKLKHFGNTYNILSIGRFHHDKNFEILLEALRILNNKKIKLILIGEGDKVIGYRQFINAHHLNVDIVIPQKKLKAYFRIADLCVLPSLHDPFPNFMLQSGLHKKPFIGANVDGIGELIKEGYNGLLFEKGNAEELAYKIMIFKLNADMAKRCALQLYSDVFKQYTQEHIIPKIEKIYRDLVS